MEVNRILHVLHWTLWLLMSLKIISAIRNHCQLTDWNM